MTTNVPPPTFGPLGFLVPSEAQILEGVRQDINAAFGGNINPALNTPQGQLATTMAATIANADQTFLYYTTQVDPAYAQGRMQDAIARIYFLERNPAVPTFVDCDCVGLAGTVLPAGTFAQDTEGNLYLSLAAATIPVGGTISITFYNKIPGPTACPAGSLNQIYRAIPGWDTITNPADGTIGSDTETRAAFEERRAESVAGNSRGTIQAIQGAVLSVDNVLDAFSYQNDDNIALTYRGVTLDPHSIYVAAVGGTDQDVAEAIWSKKSPGCAMNGNTTVTVYDTDGYDPPYPSYSIKFERPAPVTIQFLVQLTNNAQVPSGAITEIQDAIIAAFAGQDGGPRARIGGTIFASRFYCVVNALGAWVQLISIQIVGGNTPIVNGTASIAGTTMTVTVVDVASLAVGQVVSGLNIASGTKITAQLTGSPGDVGDYSVDISQTSASGVFSTFVIDQNSVTLDIDENPVTSAADIFVALI